MWFVVSYNIEMELREHCLFATACGERTGENVSAITKEILDECVRNNIVDVFLDLRQLTGRLTITDSISVITNEFPRIGLFKKLERVAVLESRERHERSRFFERVAHARGYNIRMFDDQREAADWISRSRQPA